MSPADCVTSVQL